MVLIGRGQRQIKIQINYIFDCFLHVIGSIVEFPTKLDECDMVKWLTELSPEIGAAFEWIYNNKIYRFFNTLLMFRVPKLKNEFCIGSKQTF